MSRLLRGTRQAIIAVIGCGIAVACSGCQPAAAPVVAPEKQATVTTVGNAREVIPVSQLDTALHQKVLVVDLRTHRKTWLTTAEFKSEAARHRYVLAPPAGDDF